jgi:hypothetical protein
MSDLLNPKYEAFCQAYARGPNAGNCAASYEAAGFRPDNSNAMRLAGRPHIKKRIAELMSQTAATDRQAAEAKSLEQKAVLGELAKIAYANVCNYLHVDEDGRAQIDLAQIDRDQGAAIRDLVVDYFPAPDGGTLQIKSARVRMFDKRLALGDLCRLQGSLGGRRPDSIVVPEEKPVPWTNPELENELVGVFAKLASCDVDLMDMLQRAIQDGRVKISPHATPLRLQETITSAIIRLRKAMKHPLEQ